MKTNKILWIALAITTVFTFTSCDPDDPEPPINPNTPNPVDSTFSQIPDGGFETGWSTQTADAGQYLEYQTAAFYTLNSLHAFPNALHIDGPITSIRDGNAHTGNYAMKLKTDTLHSAQLTILIPGAMGTLSTNYINDFLNSGGSVNIRKPYTDSPTAFSGFYKYTPIAGDSASISVVLYNNNTVVASGLLKEKNAVDEWTPFNVPINYVSATAPTHIEIICSASAGYDFNDLQHCQGQVNSTLYLDDIELTLPSSKK